MILKQLCDSDNLFAYRPLLAQQVTHCWANFTSRGDMMRLFYTFLLISVLVHGSASADTSKEGENVSRVAPFIGFRGAFGQAAFTLLENGNYPGEIKVKETSYYLAGWQLTSHKSSSDFRTTGSTGIFFGQNGDPSNKGGCTLRNTVGFWASACRGRPSFSGCVSTMVPWMSALTSTTQPAPYPFSLQMQREGLLDCELDLRVWARCIWRRNLLPSHWKWLTRRIGRIRIPLTT